jgi:uncharacterized protein (TIGR03437 family)
VVLSISAAGASSIFAGQYRLGAGTNGASALGPVLHTPLGLAVGPDGSLYVAEYDNKRVSKVSNGTIQKVASASGPTGVAVDSSGNVFIADYEAMLVLKVAPDGTVTTIAGGGHANLLLPGSPAVPGTSVGLTAFRPMGLVVHPNGSVYVALMNPDVAPNAEDLIRITPDGLLTILSTIPRSSANPFSGIALDASGNILLAEGAFTGVAQILRFDADGNQLSSILLPNFPITSIAAGPSGSIYIGTSDSRIRQVAADGGVITLYNRDLDQYAGQLYDSGFLFTSVLTISVATDSGGNLYDSEPNLERVRVLPAGSCPAAPQPIVSGILPSPGAPPAGDAVLVTPGELISIYGAGLGPANGVGPVLDNQGMVPSSLAGVRVLFEGIPGPVLYAGAGQVNAVVPFTMYGRSTMRVEVEYNGVQSDAAVVSMADAAPALFGYRSTAAGNPIIPIVVNPDGSLNSSANPAPAGSFITIYVTGLGETNPAGVDGELNSLPFPVPVLPVTVQSFTNDQGFSILYVGGAPELVEGVGQINIQLSKTAYSGALALTVGGASTTVPVYTK